MEKGNFETKNVFESNPESVAEAQETIEILRKKYRRLGISFITVCTLLGGLAGYEWSENESNKEKNDAVLRNLKLIKDNIITHELAKTMEINDETRVPSGNIPWDKAIENMKGYTPADKDDKFGLVLDKTLTNADSLVIETIKLIEEK